MTIRIFKSPSQRGFAVVETVLAVVILVAIVGAGSYVFKHRNDTTPAAVSPTTAPLGTTARTNQLNGDEENDESSIETSYDSQLQSNAASDSTAMSNLGGASDASNL